MTIGQAKPRHSTAGALHRSQMRAAEAFNGRLPTKAKLLGLLEDIEADCREALPQAQEDARIIAAVPALRDALRDLADWFEDLRANPWSPLHQGESNDRLSRARAALAQAKGER